MFRSDDHRDDHQPTVLQKKDPAAERTTRRAISGFFCHQIREYLPLMSVDGLFNSLVLAFFSSSVSG